MEIKNIKDNICNNAEFIKILKYSHYNPTDEKLNGLTKIYAEDDNIYTFGAFDKSQIIGFIVIKTINKQCKAYEIIDIAVNKRYRKLGIASKLIDYIIEKFDIISLSAETDEEAFGFYKKYGFNIKIGNKIGDTTRYECEYRLRG